MKKRNKMEVHVCLWGTSNPHATSYVGFVRKKSMMNLPWLMMGNFNETMWLSEHFSKKERNEKQMWEFRETFSFCDLQDLEFNFFLHKGGVWKTPGAALYYFSRWEHFTRRTLREGKYKLVLRN
jgi:hypothetical protein